MFDMLKFDRRLRVRGSLQGAFGLPYPKAFLFGDNEIAGPGSFSAMQGAPICK